MNYLDVSLRAIEPEDLGLLYEWENNDSNWVISNTVTPFSKYVIKQYIENSHKSIYETGQLRLMIDFIPDKITVGTIDVFDFDPFHKRAGLLQWHLNALPDIALEHCSCISCIVTFLRTIPRVLNCLKNRDSHLQD
jgi:RimJ/RimL family protein N-acetyltransferase